MHGRDLNQRWLFRPNNYFPNLIRTINRNLHYRI